jgi:hypothetical protein
MSAIMRRPKKAGELRGKDRESAEYKRPRRTAHSSILDCSLGWVQGVSDRMTEPFVVSRTDITVGIPEVTTYPGLRHRNAKYSMPTPRQAVFPVTPRRVGALVS